MVIPVSARIFIWGLLFCLAVARAQAAIGDDITKLRTAYGSAQQVGGQMLFKHNGYSIAVYFDGTESAMEIFVGDDTNGTPHDLTQADVDKILVIEGNGQTWSPITTHSGQPTWLRADGKVIARFNPTEKVLSVIENAK